MSDYDELIEWWGRVNRQEAEAVVPKAIEYSSSDLVDIGRAVAGPGLSDAEYAEIGIAFYAYGKCARIMGAIREGRSPSLDSWFDLSIYAKMAQRVRAVGGWPFGDDRKEPNNEVR